MTEAAAVELVAAPARAVIEVAAGGRLGALSIAGLDLLVGRGEANDDPLSWGSFPMAPWTGRLRRGRFAFAGQIYQLDRDLPPHAIHGTVYRRGWEVEWVTDRSCQLACALGPGWPLGGLARQLVELDAHALRLTLEVHAAEVPMPAACGWHPWWRRGLTFGGTLELQADLAGRWERDADGLPTGAVVPVGARPPEGWDDCFEVAGDGPLAVLRWPGAVEVTMQSDCGQVVVYDQPEHALCVEPQSGPPDSLNLDGHVVAPGEPLVAHTTWSWMLG